ncbi:MAG: hypothetical protein EOO02_04365 [Chitinophagaceae bacterium]|nr:MAG: hypothetical protein EOO02_04365 [Chitinophagaceae bacterium]
MKKKILIRLMLMLVITTLSLLLSQSRSDSQNTEDQLVDETPVAVGRRPSGEFIIWESITRYIMAGYH